MDEIDLDLNFKHEFGGEKFIIEIAQDYKSSDVIIVDYMNKKSLKTIEIDHYWSTSRSKLWLNGESSTNHQKVLKEYHEDAILLNARHNREVCHADYYSCFFRKIPKNEILEIVQEKVFDPENIYGDK